MDTPTPLASFRGDSLEKLIAAVGPESAGKARAIDEGHSVVIYIDLTLDHGARPPAQLRHRFSLSIKGENGALLENTFDGLSVAVVQRPTLTLRGPLHGSSWVAFNAFSSIDHRRSSVSVDGRLSIAQRFAIDWMRLGPEGQLFHDNSKLNANFYSYGTQVLAVADGRVSDLKDGLPDNVGLSERAERRITLENVVGNYVILDLGQRHFAVYAHLQPGSLKVKLGDTVKAGQVVALLGNSGNSDAPHLHFHLVDGNSPLGAEGLPYEIETFTEAGVVDHPEALDDGQAWQPKAEVPPTVHRREFPMNNAVVSFP